MRISQKQIQTAIYNINNFTNHKVSAMFTQGCGVYLEIDGIEYKHIRRDGTGQGLSNKKTMEILEPLRKEVINNFINKN